MKIRFLRDYGAFKAKDVAIVPGQLLAENADRLVKDGFAEVVDEATAENKKAKRASGTKVVRNA